MVDDRPEGHVVVRVPTMLKKKYFASGLQDSYRFREKFFAGTARGNLVRAESKANRVAGGILERNGEVIRLRPFNSWIGFRRRFEVAHILHCLFRRFAFDIPAIHGLNLRLGQNIGKKERVTIRADVQIRDRDRTPYATEFDEPPDIAHSGVTVHP